MNKTELINAIAAESGLSKADAAKALNATTAAIAKAVKAGDKVALVGFGTFAPSERPARTGKNPRTGEVLEIPAKTVVKFKAGSDLAL
ncbi:MAG: HU family DNA-binding protein [Bacteroidaceae bacterium]|nr:HU family DNA-binding protein [Bacteroidaceae bacterium]